MPSPFVIFAPSERPDRRLVAVEVLVVAMSPESGHWARVPAPGWALTPDAALAVTPRIEGVDVPAHGRWVVTLRSTGQSVHGDYVLTRRKVYAALRAMEAVAAWDRVAVWTSDETAAAEAAVVRAFAMVGVVPRYIRGRA